MKVGTIETLEPEKTKKSKIGISNGGFPEGGKGKGGGGNNGGNNNGGSGGGGENAPNNFQNSQTEAHQPEKSQVFMWFLLLVVFMTFGGLFGAYVVVATNGVIEWQPFDLPKQLWFSTILIFASSFTYYKAHQFINQSNQPQAKKWLTATCAIGTLFISSQLLSWIELARRGVYVQSNPYAGFFYILTVVHAAHVLGGIVALGVIFLRTWSEPFSPNNIERSQTMARVVGWYWHFMGIIWTGIFILLGFWK